MEDEYRVTNKKAEEIAAEWGFSNVKVFERSAGTVADRWPVGGADAEEEDEVSEARSGEGGTKTAAPPLSHSPALETRDPAGPRASARALQGSLLSLGFSLTANSA
eukprot:153341-Hanusia_phi.AAC.1